VSKANDAESLAPRHLLIYMFRFLLIYLNIEAILQESTVSHRRERLTEITNGLRLEDAYDAAIERMKAQGGDKSRLGIEALMWVSHAERPLMADELCYALAVEPGATDFNAGKVSPMSTVVGCCQGLITADKEGSCVRLIHSTLQEYLSLRPDIFGRPHSAIGESCLTYLNSRHVKALSTDTSTSALETPFLEYCSINWGMHAKRELSDRSRSLALQMFQEYDGHISVKLLLRQPKYKLVDLHEGLPFSGLDCASFFGIVEIVTALIEMGAPGIDEGRFRGYTPLIWAAQNGQEEMVKILLERGHVNPDKPDEKGQTPISHAARNGHVGVVKILLAQENVNPNNSDLGGKRPLRYAAQNGHTAVVRVLLERNDVNIN